MLMYGQNYFSKNRVLILSLAAVIVGLTIYLIPDFIYPSLLQYNSLITVLLVFLLVILFAYLYIRQQLRFVSQLSNEISIIKAEANEQTQQLKVAQSELHKKTALLNMLQQANLDFVEHSQFQHTAQFMMNEPMGITESKCGFIGEILKQKNGDSDISLLSICHRENQTVYKDTNHLNNSAYNDGLINEVIETGRVVIKNNETMLMVLIESGEAVRNVEDIASTDGVDILFVGFADLCQDLGVDANLKDPECDRAIRTIGKAVQKSGKIGSIIVPDPQDISYYQELGFNLIICGLDSMIMKNGATALINNFRDQVIK